MSFTLKDLQKEIRRSDKLSNQIKANEFYEESYIWIEKFKKNFSYSNMHIEISNTQSKLESLGIKYKFESGIYAVINNNEIYLNIFIALEGVNQQNKHKNILKLEKGKCETMIHSNLDINILKNPFLNKNKDMSLKYVCYELFPSVFNQNSPQFEFRRLSYI